MTRRFDVGWKFAALGICALGASWGYATQQKVDTPTSETPKVLVTAVGEERPTVLPVTTAAAPAVRAVASRSLASAPLKQVLQSRFRTDCCEGGHLAGISCAMYAPGYKPTKTDTPTPANSSGISSDFVVRDPSWKWPQPGGLGTTCTVTYSFSNLLDGGVRGITADQLRSAVRETLARWAAVAPLTFVEVLDSGPNSIADVSYSPGTTPNLRFGHHRIDGASAVLAHAFYPFGVTTDGLSGDLHFDNSENWGITPGSGRIDFLEVCLHEIGHALGLDHQNPPPEAIMNPFYAGRFTGLTTSFLFDDDKNGIKAIYGEIPTPEPPKPEPDSVITVNYNAGSRLLTLQGDARKSGLTITMRSKTLVVQAGTKTKLKQGSSSALKTTIQFTNVGTDQKISIGGDMGAGADSVAFTSLNLNVVELKLGTGADRAIFNLCSATTLKLNGGTDSDIDSLVFTSSKISGNQSTNFP